MKNIHILPTDKPSRLYLFKGRLILGDLVTVVFKNSGAINQHIYITNDSEIKEGDWYLTFLNKEVIGKPRKCEDSNWNFSGCKKIILTTDTDLIKDGVQAIDDEFLEWFVKNPSCEEVGIQKQYQYHSSKEFYIDADYVDCTKEQYESIKKEIPTCPLRILYKIIIPKEEPKQETLEEAAEKYAKQFDYAEDSSPQLDFIEGAKWQQERMYSEEDMIEFGFSTYCYISELMGVPFNLMSENRLNAEEWFEQFKKK